MLSSIFVDRPRLAIVIAIVTTIAGALALYTIPIAQYPDIVPPQVSVTTSFPGAAAGVVDSTIAQPIEAQVVGVDKMIYMKSVSGDDGSYTLLVSFELGTDPDINAVNVNNRVQRATAVLPEEVRRQGVSVTKRSSSILQIVALSSPDRRYDTIYISNYALVNVIDELRRTPITRNSSSEIDSYAARRPTTTITATHAAGSSTATRRGPRTRWPCWPPRPGPAATSPGSMWASRSSS